MKKHLHPQLPLSRLLCLSLTLGFVGVLDVARLNAASPRLTGELKQWHKITLTIDGPQASETQPDPDPFLDYRFTVDFIHESGRKVHVPGYFAADGNAAETSASSGNQWRAHFTPEKTGKWNFEVHFLSGKLVAVNDAAGTPVKECDGLKGDFQVQPTDKTGRDLRALGRLEYVGQRYLRFAGSGDYFLKAGPDSPENLLAYADFDGTSSAKPKGTARAGEATTGDLKSWTPHIGDWKPGDPAWKGGKGKGLIGALNYLASKGCNSFSFLTYNAGGDGDDVWPFVQRDDKLHYDCSKLDQWQIIFDHATALGFYCHFKTQETENDDLKGPGAKQSLDGGDLGVERKLYYREFVARFGHVLARNWNLGEENTQTTAQQTAAAGYLKQIDPYAGHIVLHTYPNEQEKVYTPLLGTDSALTGVSLQNGWNEAHKLTAQWVRKSRLAGKQWVVANDEQGPSSLGVPPDAGYKGFTGLAKEKPENKGYTIDDIRKLTLWGTIMAGGQGVEYYFGYLLPENDLNCQDFRSRDKSWDYCRIALDFFRSFGVPFWELVPADELVGNPSYENTRFCLARRGQFYLVYLPNGGSADLDLTDAHGEFVVRWFNPRIGGALKLGPKVKGGSKSSLGQPPSDPDQDWLAVVSR